MPILCQFGGGKGKGQAQRGGAPPSHEVYSMSALPLGAQPFNDEDFDQYDYDDMKFYKVWLN